MAYEAAMRMVFLATLILISACASRARPPIEESDPFAFRADLVAPHVTVMRQRASFHVQPRGNVTIIEQSRGVVLVDTGGSPAAASEVIAAVEARTSKPVTAIVLTHWHGDHVLGASRLLERWPGAHLISTQQTRAHLADPRMDAFMPGDDASANARLQENIAGAVSYLAEQGGDESLSDYERGQFSIAAEEMRRYGREMSGARRVAPDTSFEDQYVIADSETPIELYHFGPANTDGDAAAWLPRQRVLIVGDMITSPIPFGYGSYPRAWQGALSALERFPYQVMVPGHGEPRRDRAYIAQMGETLALATAKAQPFANTSEPSSEEAAAQIVWSDEERHDITRGDPWLSRWFEAYFVRPAALDAVKEARGEPILQGG